MSFLFAAERLVSYFLYFTGVYWIRRRQLERAGTGIVLVYHRVLSGKRGTGEMVGEAAFDWQMKYLRKNYVLFGWPASTDAAAVRGKIRVMVTFDDGHRDNFTRALPIMEKYEVPGVFFLATDFVFGPRGIETGNEGADGKHEPPTDEELAAAAKSRYVTFGNHSASHRIVSSLNTYEIDRELALSQSAFRERLGVTPELFAYPRGRSEDVTEAAVPILEKHRIKAAFTMIPGKVGHDTHPYFIPRIGVSHVNDRIVFKVKLLGLLGPLVKLKNRFGA